ncbi:MAG TPA: LD-carboxypeptidase [Ignavibacteriaceae bacterium]
MTLHKPKKLNKQDVIGIISPASSPDEFIRVERGVKYLESLGYRVKIGNNVGKNHGYLAGTDQERVDDIHSMFKDKTVKAIFTLRGGYGAFRLLDKIDYKVIKNNPKIFVGYSEITSLQMAFFEKAGLMTFAGPMVAVDFYDEVSDYTNELFWATITSNKKLGKLKYPENQKLPFLQKGIASGRLIGGNLAVFTALLGTPYFPNLTGKILMIEDIGELPYRVDRLLNQLRLSGAFKKVKGIILGRFVDCHEHDPNKKTLTLGEVISDYIGTLKIPSIYTFPHGHIKDFVTIPFGLKVNLNATKGTVEFAESAVK